MSPWHSTQMSEIQQTESGSSPCYLNFFDSTWTEPKKHNLSVARSFVLIFPPLCHTFLVASLPLKITTTTTTFTYKTVSVCLFPFARSRKLPLGDQNKMSKLWDSLQCLSCWTIFFIVCSYLLPGYIYLFVMVCARKMSFFSSLSVQFRTGTSARESVWTLEFLAFLFDSNAECLRR